MKKTILSLAILLASSASISAFAQAPAQKAQTDKTEMKARKGGERKQAPNPFEGLNLTEQQKTQLEALKPTKEQREQLKAQDKAKKEQMKAQAEAQKKERAEARKQARRDYLAKVKAILTPEQYLQFLENNFVDKADMRKASHKGTKVVRKNGKKGFKAQGPRKGGKPGQKSGRPDGKTDNGADKK